MCPGILFLSSTTKNPPIGALSGVYPEFGEGLRVTQESANLVWSDYDSDTKRQEEHLNK